MGPVSAGSSVLAFVLLALKSAKTIHAVLSAVKDGPQSLPHLVGDIAQLQGILERLSSLQPDSISEGDANLKVLESAANRCADDVAHIETKLQRLTIRPTDRHVGKLWKRLVTAVSEKDLTQMQTLINDHFMILSVQLGLLQTLRMSASQSQWYEMNESLRQLKEQVSALRNNPSSAAAAAQHAPPTPDTNATSDPPGTPAIDLELEESLARLVECIGGKESTVASEDAQQLIDDLEALLRAAEREESRPKNPSGGHCGQEDDVSGEFKLIRRLLAAAPALAVNRTGKTIFNQLIALFRTNTA